jgi:hypothetical protein
MTFFHSSVLSSGFSLVADPRYILFASQSEAGVVPSICQQGSVSGSIQL